MERLENIISMLSPMLKNAQYKKNRLTWYKDNEHISVVFSIQKSQYSVDSWYYIFGICLHEITSTNKHSINSCQITYRIDNTANNCHLSSESIFNLIVRWEELYGNLQLLKQKAITGKLPGQCMVNAIRYLTTI